jgi:aspartate-semialdehyde dehydrogenase
VYKIAIAGASSLLGKELKDAISESTLAGATFTLLDDEQAQGQLDQVGDEVTFVRAIDADAFDKVDFTFFCGSENLTRKHWKDALRAGSTVLDLSGALDQEAGVLVRAPWLAGDVGSADLFTPAIVPAHPAALALALLLERLKPAVPRFIAATLLVPASEFGRGAMDELHQQTVRAQSTTPRPPTTFSPEWARVRRPACPVWKPASAVTTTRWAGAVCLRSRCRPSPHRCFTATHSPLPLNSSGPWTLRLLKRH